MNQYTIEEIKNFCETLWTARIDISLHNSDIVVINIEQMYDYVELNLKHLLALSKFFGTENINDSRYHSGGCETCDYGSSYQIELTIKPD